MPPTLASGRAGLGSACARRPPGALAQTAHRVDRRMEGAPGERAAGPDEALDPQRDILGQLQDREQCAQVVRNRVKPAGVNEPRSAALGFGVIAEPHAIHELGLAGQIDVVSTGRRAGGDDRLSICDVGADRGDHDLGRCRPSPAAPRGRRVGLDQRQRRPGPDRSPPAARARPRACARCVPPMPSATRKRGGPGTRRSAAGEPAGAVDDDLMLAAHGLRHRHPPPGPCAWRRPDATPA